VVAPIATTNRHHDETSHPAAADVMNGGNPQAGFISGPPAISVATVPAQTLIATNSELSSKDGLIRLDPICETIDPPNRASLLEIQLRAPDAWSSGSMKFTTMPNPQRWPI